MENGPPKETKSKFIVWFKHHPSVTKAILFKLYVIPGLFIMTYAITGKLYESLLLLIIAIVGGFLFFIGFDKLWRMEHGMKKRLTYAITYLIFFAGVAVVCILEGKKGGDDEEEPELYEDSTLAHPQLYGTKTKT